MQVDFPKTPHKPAAVNFITDMFTAKNICLSNFACNEQWVIEYLSQKWR